MRLTMHRKREWKLAVRIALPVLIVVLLADLLLSGILKQFLNALVLEIIEILLTSFLFIDIILNLNESHNKYSFIKRNFFRIIAVFPFALMFRFLWILQIESLMSPVIFGEWLPGFANFQKVLKLERSVNFVNRVRELMIEG